MNEHCILSEKDAAMLKYFVTTQTNLLYTDILNAYCYTVLKALNKSFISRNRKKKKQDMIRTIIAMGQCTQIITNNGITIIIIITLFCMLKNFILHN